MALGALRGLAGRRGDAAAEVVLEARRVGEPFRREARFLDAFLVAVRVVLQVPRIAGLEQHPTAHGGRPFQRPGVVGGREPAQRRRFRILVALHVVTAILVDLVEVGGQLVPGTDLPRDAGHRALDVLIVDARAAVVEERVRDEVVDRVVARRREEPELVPHERPAEREGRVDDAIGGIPQRKTPVLVPRRQIVRLPVARPHGEAL